MIIRFSTRQINPKQMHAYVISTIKVLRSMGIKPADRLALYDHNSVEYAMLMICCWQMGVVACPISPYLSLTTAKEYANRIGAKHFFKRDEIKRAVSFDARQQLYAPDVLDPIDPNQEAVIIATSGSTREPKAVVLTWGNLLMSAKGSKAVIPFNQEDGWLLSLPLFHVSGVSILARVIEANASLIVAVGDSIVDDLQRAGITHISLVSTQLSRLLKDSKAVEQLQRFKAILLGGSAMPQALVEQALVHRLSIYISYGLTEMASQVATGKVVDVNQPCAKVLPNRELMIADNGEILVKGETLFKGYVVGQKIVATVDEKGWFHTGDKGYLDPNGCLVVVGRLDNMFICAGENIHPEEIEKVLLNIKGVKQAIVVPKDDPEYGARPIAFVDYEDVDESIIIAQCRKELPAIKVPIKFLPWPQLNQPIKSSRKTFQVLADTL